MFHVKHFIKLLIFQSFLVQVFSQEGVDYFCSNMVKYEKFLKEYKFKIYSSKKEVGYVNIKISSGIVYNNDEVFFSEIESYADIPILFFIGNTENYEVEYYNENFLPKRSTFISLEGKRQYVTTTSIEEIEENKFKCNIVKKGKSYKERQFEFSPPILTPGNIIPLVSTIWDFKEQKEISFKFIDKDMLKLGDLKLEYLGETENGFYKIKAILPYLKVKFLIYLDKDKNIKYAKGLGLKIYSLDYEISQEEDSKE